MIPPVPKRPLEGPDAHPVLWAVQQIEQRIRQCRKAHWAVAILAECDRLQADLLLSTKAERRGYVKPFVDLVRFGLEARLLPAAITTSSQEAARSYWRRPHRRSPT